MKKNEFQTLKQLIGLKLIRYILNADEINDKTDFATFKFNSVQVSVLNAVFKIIKELRISSINQGNYSDEFNLYFMSLSKDGDSLLNYYRRKCGGDFPEYKKEDSLMKFIIMIAIREYPNLLIKPSNERAGFKELNINILEMRECIDIVKKDKLDKISNKKNDFDYFLKLKTEDEMVFEFHVVSLPRTLIQRSFQNACNRMDYSLLSLIVEIENNISKLRDLADGKEIEYSTFVGFRNLRLKDITRIDFEDKASIRQLDGLHNPNICTRRIAATGTEDGENYISGCVLEVFHKTSLMEYPEEKGISYSEIGRESGDYQSEVLNVFKLSVVFGLNLNRGMHSAFYENGFPLVNVGNYGASDNSPAGNVCIDQKNIDEIKIWFKKIVSADLSNIEIALKRLNTAIFERYSLEDSIIDALIAWEGMFSGIGETTFKITASLAKYISEDGDRKTVFKELGKLYSLRSAIVHGETYKKENMSENRDAAIKIAIDCLKKLLDDEEMLKITANERVKKILLY